MPGTYNVGRDYGLGPREMYASSSPYWIIAIVRLGLPVSFSRETMESVTKDVSVGALTRSERPMVITDDCLQLSVQTSKRSHTKTMNAVLKMTNINYGVEIIPGDWVFAWLVNNKRDYDSLLDRINALTTKSSQACNGFQDGLKFVGRVHSSRIQIQVEPSSGTKTASCSLQCVAFSELDAQFFYDNSLASKDVLQKDLGQWLTRLGVEYEKLFADDAKTGVKQNNVNLIIRTMIDLIVGKGPGKGSDIVVETPDSRGATATPSLSNEAPFSYLIPLQVGKLLGVKSGSRSERVLAYADILELLQGVQKYDLSTRQNVDAWEVFIPRLRRQEGRRRETMEDMLGTFLPFFPEFTNQPLWAVLNRYLNPTVNEMYTALRVNPEGQVMPTIVLRQIPFTTEAFKDESISHTKFLSEMPRWQIPAVMIQSVDVGRSDATRFNFVHIYGQASYAKNNVYIPHQIVQNPPVRDDIDIMRSGLRAYMTTVECWVDDQVGQVPGTWMKLVADWTIGSHLTYNGSITCFGIQSPICEGDNLEFDGVVYHIEAISHQASIGGGQKSWTTTLQLTNGMRADTAGRTDAPLYPGLRLEDNTVHLPGLSLDERLTTGGSGELNAVFENDGKRIDLGKKPSGAGPVQPSRDRPVERVDERDKDVG